MPTRRDFLKGITIAGLGIGAKVTLPDGRQGEIEELGAPQEDGKIEAKVLLYWVCPECGAMNTQRMATCKMCRGPFVETEAITVDIGSNPHLGKEVWR
jgi:ribosomal protein L40E